MRLLCAVLLAAAAAFGSPQPASAHCQVSVAGGVCTSAGHCAVNAAACLAGHCFVNAGICAGGTCDVNLGYCEGNCTVNVGNCWAGQTCTVMVADHCVVEAAGSDVVDPLACPVLVSLAGSYGLVTIGPDGDVHLDGDRVHDCPPYA